MLFKWATRDRFLRAETGYATACLQSKNTGSLSYPKLYRVKLSTKYSLKKYINIILLVIEKIKNSSISFPMTILYLINKNIFITIGS